MINKIAGAIAVLGIIVFLGEYVLTIKSVPLGVIIVACLAMVVADYLLSFKAHRQLREYLDNKED